ncbi:MAG: hypothetical protein FJ333_00160 [Sphingomonadales bacterium]|nr:hypothetical protein [Sphingomonadales bacterium]
MQLSNWMEKCNICHHFGEITSCAIFRNMGLGIAFMRMEVYSTMTVIVVICPIKIKVFVLVISLENKEKYYAESSDMGANPLHC